MIYGGMIMVLRCFSAPDEKVNLCFYPCSCGTGPGDHDTYCQESLCIYDTDYTKLLLSYLESEFPEFDVCWDNRIPAGTWNIIIFMSMILSLTFTAGSSAGLQTHWSRRT